jgi:hypothetical protein
MARLVSAQPKFKILVANLRGGSDPSRGINPTKVRQGFEMQFFHDIANSDVRTRTDNYMDPGTTVRQGLLAYTTPPEPVGCTGTITVTDNDFTADAMLQVGEYEVVSGVHFTPGGDVDATALNLATYIDTLPGFSAVAVGPIVTLTGPFGVFGNQLPFSVVYRGDVANFTLLPEDGFLSGGEPSFGPPGIIP